MPYDEFEDFKSDFTDDDINKMVGEPEQSEQPEEKIEDLAQFVGPDEGSILDDDTALSALALLKSILKELGCIVSDFRIGFDPTGFDIKGLQIKCRNPQPVLDALNDIEAMPGQLKPQALYDRFPNSYSVTAVLGDLKMRAEQELGLSVRAAAYQNDYVVLSFFPAEQQPEPEPDIGLDMGLEGEMPEVEEELPEEEAPPEEEGGPEVPEEGVPPTEIDWEKLGI